MNGKAGLAITAIILGGNEQFAICWAEKILGAKNIKVVPDTHLASIFRDKRPGAQAELKDAVEVSVRASRASVVVVASHKKEGSISVRAQRGGVMRAMCTVQEWHLPIERIIGILFDEKGDEKEVSIMYLS